MWVILREEGCGCVCVHDTEFPTAKKTDTVPYLQFSFVCNISYRIIAVYEIHAFTRERYSNTGYASIHPFLCKFWDIDIPYIQNVCAKMCIHSKNAHKNRMQQQQKTLLTLPQQIMWLNNWTNQQIDGISINLKCLSQSLSSKWLALLSIRHLDSWHKITRGHLLIFICALRCK